MAGSIRVNVHAGTQPGSQVVRLEGALTLEVLPQVQTSLRNVSAPLLVLDLQDVPHMDSAGLGAVLHLLSVQRKAGHKLAVARPTKRVQMLFELTKVNSVLPIFPTLEAAEAS